MKLRTIIIMLIVACIVSSCSRTSSTNSVLDIIANTDYNEDGHRARWAERDWCVFSWKGDEVYSAGTSISPFGYDSIFEIIGNEFGSPTYWSASHWMGPANLTDELIASDTTKFDLCRWDGLDQIYYWCNDSLVICWSIFLMDSVSPSWYSYLTIDQLTHPQHLSPLRDLVANSVYGETHAYSEWNNRFWEVFGEKGGDDFYALTTSISTYTFDSIRGLICREYGAPTYDVHSFPKSLIPKVDTGAFWMTAKQYDRYYYWCCDSLIVGFSLAESHPSGVGYAYLSVKFLSARLALIWSKGRYETYIDSLRAANPSDMRLWDRHWFNSERDYKFANDIYYADSYETYFGLLEEYLPLGLPRNASEYDRYLNNEVQRDSLLSFNGYEGCTAEMYWYDSYEKSFTRWSIQRFTDQSKCAGLYSIEVDSAWHQYMRAMLIAVDSVVMYRPKCQGTISGMEYMAFVGRLEDDYLFSLLDALYDKQRKVRHDAITDASISAAFDSLKSHLKEHVSKEGFEDIDDCYVPLSERYIALDKDREAWEAFIKARYNFSRSLNRQQKRAYENATNNLKRNKLWLLKNEYRCYAIAESAFEKVLLPFDCSDSELVQYSFQRNYKEEYGNYEKFD